MVATIPPPQPYPHVIIGDQNFRLVFDTQSCFAFFKKFLFGWENNFVWGSGRGPASELLHLLLGASGRGDLEHVDVHGPAQEPHSPP